MSAGRVLIGVLALLALSLQAQLWLSNGGFSKTRNLRAAVAEQSRQNEMLQRRNEALEAEVNNLKQSSEAAEERARTDLGMIGPSETFYQVVTSADASH